MPSSWHAYVLDACHPGYRCCHFTAGFVVPPCSALDTQGRHIPFRASKLTLLLKDCFTSKLARVVMIAAVSPAMSAGDHTINTLRYADRVKEKSADGDDDDVDELGEYDDDSVGDDSGAEFLPPGVPFPAPERRIERSASGGVGPPRYSPVAVAAGALCLVFEVSMGARHGSFAHGAVAVMERGLTTLCVVCRSVVCATLCAELDVGASRVLQSHQVCLAASNA